MAAFVRVSTVYCLPQMSRDSRRRVWSNTCPGNSTTYPAQLANHPALRDQGFSAALARVSQLWRDPRCISPPVTPPGSFLRRVFAQSTSGG